MKRMLMQTLELLPTNGSPQRIGLCNLETQPLPKMLIEGAGMGNGKKLPRCLFCLLLLQKDIKNHHLGQ